MNSLPFANIGKIAKWFAQCDNIDILLPGRKINILLTIISLDLPPFATIFTSTFYSRCWTGIFVVAVLIPHFPETDFFKERPCL